jgi:mRNA interferase MazF
MSLIRGRVYRIDLGPDVGLKPMLVVSNNARNGQLDSVLAVRITTTPKHAMGSIVELEREDLPLVGRVLCDRISVIYEDEVKADLGAVSTATMRAVELGLMYALGIQRPSS